MVWELISRGYAKEHFPDFVVKVDKEMKAANKGARESTNNGDFKAALRALQKEERKQQKKRAREVARKINNLPPQKRVRHHHTKHSPDNEVMIQIAEMACEGKTKQEMMKEFNFGYYTVKGLIASARKYDMIPKDLIVKDKPTRNVNAVTGDSPFQHVTRKNHYVT